MSKKNKLKTIAVETRFRGPEEEMYRRIYITRTNGRRVITAVTESSMKRLCNALLVTDYRLQEYDGNYRFWFSHKKEIPEWLQEIADVKVVGRSDSEIIRDDYDRFLVRVNDHLAEMEEYENSPLDEEEEYDCDPVCRHYSGYVIRDRIISDLDLTWSTIESCYFINCIFRKVDFSNSLMRWLTLDQCTFYKCNFDYTRFFETRKDTSSFIYCT